MFLEFLGEVTPFVFKNNLKIIFSESEEFVNTEARKKFSYSYKKSVNSAGQFHTTACCVQIPVEISFINPTATLNL